LENDRWEVAVYGDETKFRLVLPDTLGRDLIEDLAQEPQVHTDLSPGNTKHKDELKCGLETAVAVVTIIVGAAQLGEICFKAARSIIESQKRHREDKDNVLIQGRRQQALTEVDETIDADHLGSLMQVTAARQ
jgi:hypothetical protein